MSGHLAELKTFIVLIEYCENGSTNLCPKMIYAAGTMPGNNETCSLSPKVDKKIGTTVYTGKGLT